MALKMILAGGDADEHERARFKTEAEAVARLQHPNIVQIHEVGEHADRPYCVLEYVDGGSLARKLASLPPTASEAAALVETLARAVEHAHQKGIVHRDLKPGNVLLTTEGLPKVTDFGLARMLDAERRTVSGEIVGTPCYMAPEQAAGKHSEVGPRADVWALGAILYECLTGQPPFVADHWVEVLYRLRTQDAEPPRRLRPEVPPALETICLKCLQKEPAKRYASAADLAEDLRRFLAGRPIEARRPRPGTRGLLWLAASAAVLLALAAGTLWFNPWRPPAAQLVTAPPSPSDDAERGPDISRLRQDFPLQVELLGPRKDAPTGTYVITAGQLLSVRIEAPQACYVGIWYENEEEKKVFQLFPNERDPEHLVVAGKERLIPGEKEYEIRSTSPSRGRLRVLASTVHWDPIQGQKAGPFVVATPEELEEKRNFTVQAAGRAISEYVFPMRVEPR